MAPYLLDWLQLLIRWFHVVAGIAWIGGSFYFIWLDNHLRPLRERARVEKDFIPQLWTIHSGTFYCTSQPQLALGVLPESLHWFKWESYFTWISGFFLLSLIYYLGADVYLIDPRVSEIGAPAAIAIGIVTLLSGWILYDRLCRCRYGQNPAFLTTALAIVAVVAAWGLCHVFSGRGAFIHYGAMFGTIMAGNVFFLIVPAQKELVRATREMREPDPMYSIQAKRRSRHNTYFTFLVLFTMFCSHYPMTFSGPYNWLVLLALSLAGATARLCFIAHQNHTRIWPSALVTIAVMTGLIFALAPTASKDAHATSSDFAHVRSIVQARCVGCHSQTPTHPGFAEAPKGVALDTPESIILHGAQISQQVSTRVMPLANLTGMTDAERDTIVQWFAYGAHGK